MFKFSGGEDVLDQIRYAHDQGFTAWEHSPMPNETPELQEKISHLLRDLKMRMGAIEAYRSIDPSSGTDS